MYILLALVAACALGIGAHYLLPNRDRRGAALAPALTTVAAGGLYTGMQWAGIAESNPLLWLVSILGGTVIGVLITGVITRMRVQHDAQRRAALGL